MLRWILPVMRTLVRLAMCALLFAGAGGDARAQQADAAIVVGTVFDTDTATLPGVAVTVTNQTTGVSITVVTNERGQYRTPPLRIGTYDVTAELSGFKRWTRQGVQLSIGDVRNVDAVLEIGGLEESITVEGAVPLLNTSDSTVGTVITNDHISALPLNGRNYLQLAALSAGTGPDTGAGVSIGGQPGTQVAFLLDGQDNNKQSTHPTRAGQKEVIRPSIDAIQEFKVVTNGYAAEYGRSSSGVVSVSLKGGSNTVHGGAFEFLRDDRFDATNYFAATKPDFNRHQFGGFLGGPIVRNRTFFFANLERGRIRRTSTTVSTVPTDSVRAGQFSRTIRDPLAGGTPFPNNQVPTSRFDPVSVQLLGFWPDAQTGAATNNFVVNTPNDEDELSWDIRVDHVFSPRQNVYVRYSSQGTDGRPSSPLPQDAQGNFVTGGSSNVVNSKSIVAVHNYVWSPSVISSIRVGWNEFDWANEIPDQPLRGIGIPGVDSSQPGFSSIGITGYRGLGVSNTPNYDRSRNAQLAGDLTWNKGAHTFKGGIQAYRLESYFHSSQRSAGIFSFNGQYTGDPFADFLLGYASSANLSKWATLDYVTPYTHFFVQDDWRATQRLTFNLGVRYELSPPPVERHDGIANFDLDTDPANPRIVLAGQEGDDRASRALMGVNYGLVAPRVGLAYSLPDERTVIRAGTGVFYSNMMTAGGMESMEINPPNHVRINQSTDRNAPPVIFLRQGFDEGALTPAGAADVNLISYDRRNRVPTSYQWNVNVQRELPGRILLEVGYTSNRLVNAWRMIDGNPAPPGPGNINSRRLIQTATDPVSGESFTLADITRVVKDGWTRYHGLETRFERRYANGVSIIAAYAWSKTTALQGGAPPPSRSGPQDPHNLDAEIGPADTHRPHHFVASGVYELPFGRDRRFGSTWSGWTDAALGGWALSPILRLTSGAPLNLSVNGNPSNTGGNDRPNVVGDWEIENPTADRWFNTEAFEANAPFTFGDAPRNLLRGPGYVNLDIALRKLFRVSGRVTAELRFESFNATNRVNLGNPNTQVGNSNFGVISSAGAARSNQVAFKFLF